MQWKISLMNGAEGADPGRGTGFEEAAVDHDSERVGDGKDCVHVVFDQQDRMVLRQIAQQGNDAHRLFGAHAAEWLAQPASAPARGPRPAPFPLPLLATSQARSPG